MGVAWKKGHRVLENEVTHPLHESAALEPLPNFPDGIEGSIVQKWMSHAVEKSATIFNLIFLLKPCATLPY